MTCTTGSTQRKASDWVTISPRPHRRLQSMDVASILMSRWGRHKLTNSPTPLRKASFLGMVDSHKVESHSQTSTWYGPTLSIQNSTTVFILSHLS